MLTCTHCRADLKPPVLNADRLVPCPGCRGLLRIDVYPALYRALPPGHAGETLQAEKQASCFYHARKKAVRPCSACGRFLCALCDIELNGRHLCPACLETGRTKRKIQNLENHRVCYDQIALYVAVISLLAVWLSVITAPVVLFMTIRYWKAPASIVQRTKIRFVVASILATLQMIGWVFLFSNLVMH
ncbi:MAG: hypothetical protein JSW39_24285 [Desulfobacterales bacterium]|nr:MAG: hypothetical protein JSW39_24285 [Desulfobacterales bacterium]